MKKSVILLSLLILSACAPNEANFKSDIPPLADRVIYQSEKTNEMPSQINLNVPFFPQAPDGDWGIPWQEACEEASVILSAYYAFNINPSKDEFKREVLKLVDWENEHFGGYEHTTIDQTAKMMKENFQFSSFDFQILEDPGLGELKQELVKGNVIVAPFAGRQLGNPFYSGEGPYYHMMVIKGYDEKNFITNDVGTRRGENFIYPHQTILSALHDWHDTDITLGEKKVIVVQPLMSVGEVKMEK